MDRTDFAEWGGRVLRGGGGERRVAVGIVLLLAAGVIVVWGLLSAFYSVEPDGKAVVKRFGRVVAVRDPGLHVKLPFGIDRAWFVPTERVLKEEFGFRTVAVGPRTRYGDADLLGESLMLTGDLNVIDVTWVVQYRVQDPDLWLHRVLDQPDTIRDISESVMRRIVGNRLGSDVLTIGRAEVAAEVKAEMQRILDGYEMGVHIQAVELQDVTPPDPVKPAFNEVNESRQQKESFVNVAEKERNQVVPRARGEAERTISEARAYASERVNTALGEAGRFQAVLAEYQKAPDVTRQRLYLEAVRKVLEQVGGLYVVEAEGSAPLPVLDLERIREGAGARRAREGGR